MPKLRRDLNSCAVIIEYKEHELENMVGYRLLKLEKKVMALERMVRRLFYILERTEELVGLEEGDEV